MNIGAAQCDYGKFLLVFPLTFLPLRIAFCLAGSKYDAYDPMHDGIRGQSKKVALLFGDASSSGLSYNFFPRGCRTFYSGNMPLCNYLFRYSHH